MRPPTQLRSIRAVAPLLLAAAVVAAPAVARACTTFLLEGAGGQRVVGKSYDWYQGQGLALWNPRGLAKTALGSAGDRPARWTSRYASLTFNQYGREFPTGGMNDQGLVVEVMWLQEAEYPPPDARPSVESLQWIQYQLDRYATAAEVAEHARDLRVRAEFALVHFLACDRGGDCVAVEHVDGREVVSRGARALTNSTYAASAAHLGFARSQGPGAPSGASSLDRFARAVRLAEAPAAADLRRRAFEILDSVSLGRFTKWNIVYDPVRLRVAFRLRGHPVKEVALSGFDPRCGQPARMLDLEGAGEGDRTASFEPYTAAANARLVRRSMAAHADEVPSALVDAVASYPGTLACAEP